MPLTSLRGVSCATHLLTSRHSQDLPPHVYLPKVDGALKRSIINVKSSLGTNDPEPMQNLLLAALKHYNSRNHHREPQVHWCSYMLLSSIYPLWHPRPHPHTRTHANTRANKHMPQAKRPRAGGKPDLEEATVAQVDKLKGLERVANAMHVPTDTRLLHAGQFQDFLGQRRSLIIARLQQHF